MDYQKLIEAVYDGETDDVVEIVNDCLKNGTKAEEILNDGLMKGMDKVSEDFKNEEIFVPEVLISARAMNNGIDRLKPYLDDGNKTKRGAVVIGTVKGDMHDIGKNLVKIMMEGKGINVIDLGVDVDPEKFIDEAIKNNAKIICCSSLLTTTMPQLKIVCNLVKEKKLDIKVMVGGAPVNEAFANSIGADAYTEDAASAAAKAIELLGD